MMNSSDGNGRTATVDVPVSDQPSLWQRVVREFACDHPNVILTKFTKSNATVEFRKQCQTCGDIVGCVKKALITAEQMRAGIPDFDRSIGDTRRQAWARRYDELRAELRDEEGREWRDRYERHLRSPAWARKRQLVLDREKGVCQGCRESRAVEVHHLSYQNLGNEPLFELVALCSPCHRNVHGRDE